MQRFKDKTVIVTGASSGIGEGIARRFSEEGANVVLNARSEDDLKEVAKDLPSERTFICSGDVSDAGTAQHIIDATIEKFGQVDVLCNNAGIAQMGELQEVEEDKIDDLINVNIKGVINMARAAYEPLKDSKGSIVNTSSVSGIGGDWGLAVYNTTKGAVTNLTRSLALDWGKDGIRVNAVNPSLVRSELSEGIFENDELLDRFKERIPMGRAGEPEDVAGPVLFLASDDAGWVSGIQMPVDGGLSASNGQPPIGEMQDE